MSSAQIERLSKIYVQEGVFLGCLFVAVAFFLWMLYILYMCVRRIPPVHREVQPWQVWLVLVPFAGWFFGFFIFPNLSRSYQNYFEKHPRLDVGSCGHQLSLWVAWTFVLGSLPLGKLCALPFAGAGVLLTPVFLVLLVMFVMEVVELKKLVPADAEREQADETGRTKSSKITSKWRDNREDSWHSTTPGKKAPVDPEASDEILLDLNSLTSALAQPEIDATPVQPPEETKPADDEDAEKSPQ